MSSTLKTLARKGYDIFERLVYARRCQAIQVKLRSQSRIFTDMNISLNTYHFGDGEWLLLCWK